MCAVVSASMTAKMVSTGTPEAVNVSLNIATVQLDITSTLIQIIANVFHSLVQLDICGTPKNAPANANFKKIAATLMESAMQMQFTISIHPPAAAVVSM
jgi:hypothetical protein